MITAEQNLPEGWAFCSVEDIGELIRGITYKKEQSSKSPGPSLMPILRANNINGGLNFDDLVYVPRSIVEENQSIKQGDIVFAMSSGSLHLVGKSAQAQADWDGSCGAFCAILRIDQPVFSKFLAFLFQGNAFRRKISEIAKGSNINNLKREHILEHQLALPPLTEQRRIVAKIEELFSELDKGIENLKLAQAQLTVYRQALLKHAFEGKLTAAWRAKQLKTKNSKLETGTELLARIRAEREARYQKQLAEWKLAVASWETAGEKGQRPTKPREPKELKPLADDVRENLAELPESWAWDVLGWMTNGVEYGSAAKSSDSGTHVVLRMGNLQNGNLDWNDLAFSSDADEIAQYLLQTGDVLFNRTNSPEWVGKTAIYRGERPALFAGYLIRVNHSTAVVRSEYLNWFLNSPVAKQYGNTVKTDGVNQSNINGEKLAHYPFPYCSLAEQDEIVRILEETLSLIDRTVEDNETNLQKAEALRQAILKKAFAGELVPQNLADEPAAELLKRIRAERAVPSPTGVGEGGRRPDEGKQGKAKQCGEGARRPGEGRAEKTKLGRDGPPGRPRRRLSRRSETKAEAQRQATDY